MDTPLYPHFVHPRTSFIKALRSFISARHTRTSKTNLMKPFQYYAAYGYYVARNAVPRDLIRSVSDAFYGEMKTCSDPILRQSGKKEVSRFDNNGFITNPVVNPHLCESPRVSGFREAVLACTCSSHILQILQTITLHEEHVLQQVMVFEQTATNPHQDWVYLDSFPPGHLSAAWVALEDIHQSATRFFVIPGSQDIDSTSSEEEIWSGRYTAAVKELVNTQFSDQITIPEMRAGDVLFWNSRVIHGSLPGSDPGKSRFSLTAHYIPQGFGYGKRNEPCLQAFPYAVEKDRAIAYLKP